MYVLIVHGLWLNECLRHGCRRGTSGNGRSRCSSRPDLQDYNYIYERGTIGFRCMLQTIHLLIIMYVLIAGLWRDEGLRHGRSRGVRCGHGRSRWPSRRHLQDDNHIYERGPLYICVVFRCRFQTINKLIICYVLIARLSLNKCLQHGRSRRVRCGHGRSRGTSPCRLPQEHVKGGIQLLLCMIQ